MLLLYMFITLLCIPIDDKAGEVVIGKVDMACGVKVVGVKISPTSRDYISDILDGSVIFISICFMIIYRIVDLGDD